MPTPVGTARQCLTPEAAHALDEAVAVARRRGHAQTTSLHVVSALLSLPSSTLRDACVRARNCAYSPRLQFKALELCLSVSLDRVSSSQQTDEPPVSNSLMAAIKRSQANQRRQPENFHLYHHQLSQSSSSSVTVIKVELQHLILSILDDPVVSRVFTEAGFRSTEIKLAILRPLASQLFKFSRSRAPPPIFLCNYLNENFDPGPGRRRLSSSFPGFGGFLDGEDENSKRISEVLLQRKNPLLMGVHAFAALKNFYETIEKKNINDIDNNHNGYGLGLPAELSGLNIISIENEISRFITGNSDKETVDNKFEEVGLMLERSLEPGVVVNYGDLQAFVNYRNNSENNNANNNNNDNNETSDAANHVVAQLTQLLQQHGGKVWLLGAAALYDTYLKFVSKFPSIEKDWDLQLLPITSLRPSSMAESHHRSRSRLMESFVPFGGFFSTPSDLKSPLSSSYQSVPRCHQCNEKCEQEIIASSKGGVAALIADQHQSVLPSWLQMVEPGTNKGFDPECRPKMMDWHCSFQFLQDKENAGSSGSNISAPPSGNSCINVNSGITIDLETTSASTSVFPFNTVSKSKNESLLSKLWEKPSKPELDSGGLRSPCSLSNSTVDDSSRTSPMSVTSVTTDLGLRIGSAATSIDLKKATHKDYAELSQELSGCCSASVDFVNGGISNHPAQSTSSSCPDSKRNWKTIFRALTERIGWQEEAICAISQTIAHRRTGNENHPGASPRGDIWFNFTGPDSLEGKPWIDYVAWELYKKPLSVVFLENVDKADEQVQSSLSKAIRTGKFSDSYGREVGISNAIFVTTSSFVKDIRILPSETKHSNYSEERILGAKSWPMQIIIESALANGSINQNLMTPSEMVKRAHRSPTKSLDLNLPADEDELPDTDEDKNSENDSSENSKSWLQDFSEMVETVVFKPFNFDALADKVVNDIDTSFRKIVGSECMLEIHSKVMEQLLAAAYLSDRNRVVEDWLEKVLSRGFQEVQEKYKPTANCTAKLVACEGNFLEEQRPGVCLPSKIILN
ncbi:Protein SMAX1-LIKE like [Melia azedarach]|uniref:Protein SMAX1-LIKE like n=1 Tax=Melia azedarach TaxID=155640 RepID=A0ACC1Y9X1_MELAZ|nr:Protein SMAX1-LIKE like [Melia azedarach]